MIPFWILFSAIVSHFLANGSTGQACNAAVDITTYEASGATDILLEWQVQYPDNSCNTTLLKHFDITCSSSSLDLVTRTVGPGKRSYTTQVQTPCTTQTCFIEANFDDDTVAKSEKVNVTLEEIPAIEDLNAAPVVNSFDRLNITWSAVPATCDILNYSIKYKLSCRDQCDEVDCDWQLDHSLNPSIVLYKLKPHSTYDVEVEPVPETAAVHLDVIKTSAQTGEGVPTMPPADLIANNKTQRHLHFTWDKPPCGHRNGVIIWYEYSICNVTADEMVEDGYVDGTSVEFSELEDYVEYNFTIRAHTSGGWGNSSTIDVRTAEGVPAAPEGFKVNLNLNIVDLSWDPFTAVPGNIIAYHVYHTRDQDKYETYTRIKGHNVTSFKLHRLHGRSKYTFKVRAETGGGLGNWSKEETVRTTISIAGLVGASVILASLIIVIVSIVMVVIYKNRTAPLPLTILEGAGRYNPYGVGLPGEIAWSKVSLGEEVGEGRFGRTYLTMLLMADEDERHQVVCKQMTFKVDADKEEVSRQMSRLCQMSRHAHVLRIMGFCQRKNHLYILKVHANKGNLYSYIHRDRPYGIPQLFKLRVSVAVAHGMQHLASHMVVHGDLCLKKVLLNDDGREWEPKISGYGLVECCHDFQMTEDTTGTTSDTTAWPVHQYPPEKIERNIYDTKGDVWAFGVLLWEFFTETPIPSVLKTGRIVKCPATLDESLYNIMKHCWLIDPRKRPQFFDLADALTAFLTADIDNSDEDHPYDILKPKEHRRPSQSQGHRGSISSTLSQPRVSISTTDAPRCSLSSRSASGIRGVYYGREDEIALVQEEEHGMNLGIQAPGSLGLSEDVRENHYSMRMNSIIPGHRSSSLPGVHTIEEEGEEEEGEEEDGDGEEEEGGVDDGEEEENHGKQGATGNENVKEEKDTKV